MTTPLIEAIARAMADEMKSNSVYVSDDLRNCLIDGGLFDLHGTAQAALTAITEAGMVIVPREPTEAMEAAGNLNAGMEAQWHCSVNDVFRTMIDAAPPLDTKEGE